MNFVWAFRVDISCGHLCGHFVWATEEQFCVQIQVFRVGISCGHQCGHFSGHLCRHLCGHLCGLKQAGSSPSPRFV